MRATGPGTPRPQDATQLVSADAQVLFLNHAARMELDGQHPLRLLGHSLGARRPQDVAPLYDALACAQRGLRKLVTLGARRLCWFWANAKSVNSCRCRTVRAACTSHRLKHACWNFCVRVCGRRRLHAI